MTAGTVLCAIDRDDRAGDLVVAARRVACVTGLRPVFVHVARTAEAGAAEMAEVGVARSELRVLRGDPERELLGLVRDERPAIAVVGATHRGILVDALLGGVCAKLAQDPSCPVMVVAPGMTTAFEGGPVVCGVKLDDTAGRCANWASSFAALTDRWLVLAHVVSTTQIAALATAHAPASAATVGLIEAEERTARQRLDATRGELDVPAAARSDVAVRTGTPAVGLVELAEDLAADAIVVGAHRRAPFREAVIGSIWRELWRRAPCPVIVVADE